MLYLLIFFSPLKEKNKMENLIKHLLRNTRTPKQPNMSCYFLTVQFDSSNKFEYFGSHLEGLGVSAVFWNENGIIDMSHPFREAFLKYGENPLRQIQRVVQVSEAVTNITPMTTGSFGHAVCTYLAIFDHLLYVEILDAANSQLFSFTPSLHLTQLNQWLCPDSLNLKSYTDKNVIYQLSDVSWMTKLNWKTIDVFPRAKYRPILDYALSKLVKPVTTNRRKIAIIKTDTDKMSVHENSAFTRKSVLPWLNKHGYILLPHTEMTMVQIATTLHFAESVIFSWGALAYYALFLKDPRQKCHVLFQRSYGGQSVSVCFDKKLFSGFTIIPNLPSNLTPYYPYLNKILERANLARQKYQEFSQI